MNFGDSTSSESFHSPSTDEDASYNKTHSSRRASRRSRKRSRSARQLAPTSSPSRTSSAAAALTSPVRSSSRIASRVPMARKSTSRPPYASRATPTMRTPQNSANTPRSTRYLAPTSSPPCTSSAAAALVTPLRSTARMASPQRTAGRNSSRPRQQTVRVGVGRRKQGRPQHISMKLFKEMKHLMKSTDLQIPRACFGRLVKEILHQASAEQTNGFVTMMTSDALSALQESSEMYITQQLQDAYTLTLHRGRVTLSVKDMEALRFIREGF